MTRNDEDSPTVRCRIHGARRASVICGHMVGSTEPVGFVENSSDPDDLQGWCRQCEAVFLKEGGMTETFLTFNQMSVVCTECYATLKARHSSMD